MTRSKVFIRREWARRIRSGRRETTAVATTKLGRESRGRGLYPWRTPPETTRSTAPLPTDRVLLLLTPNPPKMMPRTTMMKRGAWWE